MIFQNIFELMDYLRDKDLNKLNFEISNIKPQATTSDEPASEPETILTEPPVDVVDTVKEMVEVSFKSFSDNPIMEFSRGSESVLVVEDFEHIPNSCSTSKVTLGNRVMTIGICESDGHMTTAFDVIVDGVLHANKQFTLVTDKSKYKNTISV